MFINLAYAQSAGAGSAVDTFSAFIPIILIFVVFYFLLIRPQQKRMKEHQLMLNSVRRGDKIVTNGGIIGLVTKVLEDEQELQVEISENVRVKVKRDMLSSVIGKSDAGAVSEKKQK
tara:strand:- start:5 stop:355 length:351 start_codon:yes stop_codon:yes gene_type:complete